MGSGKVRCENLVPSVFPLVATASSESEGGTGDVGARAVQCSIKEI